MTLLELVITAGLIGIVGLSFSFLYASAQRFLIQSTNMASSQSEAAFAVEHVKRRLLQATSITTPANGVTGATTLTFVWVPSMAEAASPRTSTYSLSGGNLQCVTGIVTDVIARNITAVSFGQAVRGSVTLQVTARRSAGNDINRDTVLQTTINPRAL